MNLLAQATRPTADNTRIIPLTQGQFALVDVTDYESLSQFKWQALWNRKTRSFYAARTTAQLNHKGAHTVMMHRQILGLAIGDKRQVDHIESGQTLDNRRCNLRIVTQFDNQHNRRKMTIGQSRFKGVTRADKKWKAEIVSNGKWYYLGVHPTQEAAARAYDKFVFNLHGEFAVLNFPRSVTSKEQIS